MIRALSFSSALALVSGILLSQPSQARIFPKNDLDRYDVRTLILNIDQKAFDQVIDEVVAAYEKTVASHGATLIVDRLWDDSTVNAGAEQYGTEWHVLMYGGLVRRPEVTADSFTIVVCHELGHHLGGYPFWSPEDWAANEGEADYFATQECAKGIWKDAAEENAKAAATVDPAGRSQCDAVYGSEAERNLCYRISNASLALAKLMYVVQKEEPKQLPPPDLSKHDSHVVTETDPDHSLSQCRLDTYMAGAVCKASFDLSLIPGRNKIQGQDSIEAETEAARSSCTNYSGFSDGLRPTCWYKARL